MVDITTHAEIIYFYSK